jgi:hypothetical protein
MSIRLDVIIDKGLMPRHGVLNKPLNLLLDNRIIADIDWGDKRSFEISAGKHTLTLKPKTGGTSNTLDFEASDGETITINSFLDMENGKLSLINMAEISPADSLLKRRKKQVVTGKKIISVSAGVCAGLGLCVGIIAPFIPNITRGIFQFDYIVGCSGGFIGFIIGGALGAAIGIVINALRRK